jgi:hypothetical protein
MAMKKTFGGDSPLQQGAEKSFWTLPISGRRRRQIAMCFWKSDRVFRFFPSGVFIGEGAASEVDLVGLTTGGCGPALGRAPGGVAHQWLLSVSSLVFWKLH